MTITSLIISETIQNKPALPENDLVQFAQALLPEEITESRIVMVGENIHILATQTAKTTGLNVITLEDPRFFLPNPELMSKALPDVIKEEDPSYICFTHTARGCLTAAKLSKTLEAPLITNVESLHHNGNIPVFRRSIFNGKFVMDIEHPECPIVLTVIPGTQNGSPPSVPVDSPGKVVKRGLSGICGEADKTAGFLPIELKSLDDSDNALEEADIVVSVGKGMESSENIDMAGKVATLLKNATIGASRIACDMGWQSHSKQIGETGKTVAPKLYLACGISGSAQHVAGIKNAQMIIAINKDPNAAIFSIANYGIVEDLKTFLPLLIDKIEQD